MKTLFALSVMLAFAAAAPGQDRAAIPDRPEKLTFPPLRYEPPQAADYRVALPSGAVAYVAPDRELPLVNIQIYVHTGTYVVPRGQEGLADLTGWLMAHGGTASKTAEQLEERLAFLAAKFDCSITEMSGSVTLNLLAKDLDEGLGILREALTAPRFQEDKLKLHKEQMLQAMHERNDESSAIEMRERNFLAFGDGFFLNRYSTGTSVSNLTVSQVREFQQRWFYPSNFVIAVNGDFDRDRMIEKLNALLANWPFKGETPPPVPTEFHGASPGLYLVNKDVNQGRVAMILPGMQRDDRDYFPALLMNDILGGGGFTSRIMSRVRSDEGLAYSAGSAFPGGVYFPLTFRVGFQSKSRTVGYAISIVEKEVRRILDERVTEAELHTAKRALIDTFPRSFSTKTQVAQTLAEDEFTGRYAKNPTYWQTYRDNVDKVTREDIQRVAQRFLHPDQFAILVVGKKDDILKGHPERPVDFSQLAAGGVKDLPLRDPMTMERMPAPR
ncbi:MAG TPA: pitrilysin family protein [Verrucomicrobiae bacterium]|nr:pitrilysin family protein [Verrucomicrobiae bacterium]